MSCPDDAMPATPPDARASAAIARVRTVRAALSRECLAHERAVEALSDSERHFHLLVDHLPLAICAIDRSHRVLLANPACATLLGHTPEELRTLPSLLSLIEAEAQQSAQHHLAAALQGQVRHAELTLRHKAGHAVRVASILLPHVAHGAVDGAMVLLQDLTPGQAEEALRRQALHDALTDLPNRTLLYDRVEQAIRMTQRDPQPLALLLLDLDRFKEVNDTFGHHVGDALLQQVAERLRAVVRATDTVARLGGDEFALLLPHDDRAGAIQAAHRLQAALTEPFEAEGHTLHVGVSIGIALYPAHGRDGTTLLRHADVAMYTAKRAHTTFAIYEKAHDPYTPERLTLAGELRRAVVRRQLVLHYQPKVRLSTGRVYGLEALVRWQHPRHGLLFPSTFVPLAEQTGLIGPLTRWVLEAALQQCQRWRQAGLPLGVAVNLSMLNLHDRDLPDLIADLLARYGLPATALWLEVTESVAMADAARTLENLGHLSSLGVALSIDDFGTGYSSLAYLKRFPVQEIKIDRAFVQHMVEDTADTAIVASTIALGHNLGRSVMAEGVETAEAWHRLRQLGCDAAQGYYLTRPLPADDLVAWLQQAPWSLA